MLTTVVCPTEVLASCCSPIQSLHEVSDELRPCDGRGFYINFWQCDNNNFRSDRWDPPDWFKISRVGYRFRWTTSWLFLEKALNLLKGHFAFWNVPVTVSSIQSNAYFKVSSYQKWSVDDRRAIPLITEKCNPYENPNRIEYRSSGSCWAHFVESPFMRIRLRIQVRLKLTGSECMISAEDLDFSNEGDEDFLVITMEEISKIGFTQSFW